MTAPRQGASVPPPAELEMPEQNLRRYVRERRLGWPSFKTLLARLVTFGGALALALAYASYVAFRGVGPMAGLVFFKPLQMLLLLVFGVLLGLVGSLVSVGRHLREV